MPEISIPLIGLAISGAMAGLSASGAMNPKAPNLATSSAELANAQAQLLPIQRALAAAAQQGTSITLNLPAHVSSQQMVRIPAGGGSGGEIAAGLSGGVSAALGVGGGNMYKWIPYVASDWAQGGKYYDYGQKHPPRIEMKPLKVAAGPQTFDFSGYGAGDVQSKLADAMAKVQLALGQKYDSQFIDQSLAQEKLADPEGFAARGKMNDLIQEQINRPLNEPVADELERQVAEELNAARNGRLDPAMHDVLMQGGAEALRARGGTGTITPDFEQPLTTGAAGTHRELAAIGKATGELASGQTPEDIAYRREQQDLANLSAFTRGQTPQSQFRSLSGAQNGPAPFAPGQPLPTMPNNGAAAQGAALGAWKTQMGADANQANSWVSGLSAILGLGKTAAGLGWQPFANG